jgi:hypothetical protein
MHSIAQAVVQSGLLSEETLAEFRRWGHPIEAPPPIPKSLDEVVLAIEQALQEEGLVVTRETDLEAVATYLTEQRSGVLHVVLGEGAERVETDIPCSYSYSKMGDYLIRWHADSIEEVLTNGETYLLAHSLTLNGSPDVPDKVFFNRVREVFFGETKAFIVCTPTKDT